MQLMVQLVKVSQVQTTIQGPASRAQASRFSADYFCIAEESIEHLPHQDEGAQQQIGQTNQQDDSTKLLGEL